MRGHTNWTPRETPGPLAASEFDPENGWDDFDPGCYDMMYLTGAQACYMKEVAKMKKARGRTVWLLVAHVAFGF